MIDPVETSERLREAVSVSPPSLRGRLREDWATWDADHPHGGSSGSGGSGSKGGSGGKGGFAVGDRVQTTTPLALDGKGGFGAGGYKETATGQYGSGPSHPAGSTGTVTGTMGGFGIKGGRMGASYMVKFDHDGSEHNVDAGYVAKA